MAPSRFGADATGDPNLMADLRAGRSPRFERLHRIAAFMKARDVDAGFCGEHDAKDVTASDATSSGTSAEVSQRVAA
jgi:hypothetical protein